MIPAYRMAAAAQRPLRVLKGEAMVTVRERVSFATATAGG